MPEHWPLSQHADYETARHERPARAPSESNHVSLGSVSCCWQHGEHGEDKLALSPVRTACTPSECVPTDTLACTCGRLVHVPAQHACSKEPLPTGVKDREVDRSRTHRVRARRIPFANTFSREKPLTAHRPSRFTHFHSPTRPLSPTVSPRFCCIAAQAGPTSSGLDALRGRTHRCQSRSTRPTRSLNSYTNDLRRAGRHAA